MANVFNPNGLTATQRNLTFGTKVRYNLRNGKSVVCHHDRAHLSGAA